jgi:hypothetical protein
MTSLRPSVFNSRERSDGGPFLLVEPVEQEEGFSIDVAFIDTPRDAVTSRFGLRRRAFAFRDDSMSAIRAVSPGKLPSIMFAMGGEPALQSEPNVLFLEARQRQYWRNAAAEAAVAQC